MHVGVVPSHVNDPKLLHVSCAQVLPWAQVKLKQVSDPIQVALVEHVTPQSQVAVCVPAMQVNSFVHVLPWLHVTLYRQVAHCWQVRKDKLQVWPPPQVSEPDWHVSLVPHVAL